MSDNTRPLLTREENEEMTARFRKKRTKNHSKKKAPGGEAEVLARQAFLGRVPEQRLGKEAKGRLATLRKFADSCRVSADGTSNSSSGPRADQGEDFNNFGCSAESPNADTPPEETEMIEEMANELKARTKDKKDPGLGKQVALLLTNCFNFPYLLLLPWHYARHGVSYLIVLFTLTALFAFPTALMELACGQYTSLDPSTFFRRLSPAGRGVGWFYILFRCFSMVASHNDMRHLLYLKPHMVGLFITYEEDVVGTMYGSPTSGMGQERLKYECFADNKAIFLNGTCMEPPEPMEIPFLQSLAILMKAEPSRFRTPAHIMIGKETYPSKCRAAIAVLVGVVVAAAICVRGIGCLFKLSFVLASAPFIAIFSIAYFLIRSPFVQNLDVNWRGLIVVRPESWTDPYLYTDALSSMFALYSIGDGSWHFVGSFMNYRKNLVIPVVVSLLLQSLLVLLFTFVLLFLNTSFVLHRLSHFGRGPNGQVDRGLDEYAQETEYFNYDSIDYLLPEMGDGGVGPYIVFKLAVYIGTIGYQATTYETIVQILIWGLPRLSTLKSARFYIVIAVSITNAFYGFTAAYGNHVTREQTPSTRDYLGVYRSAMVFAQFSLIVFAYGHDRLLVNIQSMFSRNGNALSVFLVSFLRFSWRRLSLALIVCHFFIHFIRIDLMSLTRPSILNTASLILPLMVFVFKWGQSGRAGEAFNVLFRPHYKFGPSALLEKRRAALDERAAKARPLSSPSFSLSSPLNPPTAGCLIDSPDLKDYAKLSSSQLFKHAQIIRKAPINVLL